MRGGRVCLSCFRVSSLFVKFLLLSLLGKGEGDLGEGRENTLPECVFQCCLRTAVLRAANGNGKANASNFLRLAHANDVTHPPSPPHARPRYFVRKKGKSAVHDIGELLTKKCAGVGSVVPVGCWAAAAGCWTAGTAEHCTATAGTTQKKHCCSCLLLLQPPPPPPNPTHPSSVRPQPPTHPPTPNNHIEPPGTWTPAAAPTAASSTASLGTRRRRSRPSWRSCRSRGMRATRGGCK